jgi:hypothetical protein
MGLARERIRVAGASPMGLARKRVLAAGAA